MRRTIDGVIYNTKDSISLGKFNAGFPRSDIRWYTEELFRTKTSNYFLYGTGGPASPYASCNEIGIYSDGEKIIPMSQEKVIIWANEYLPDYELEKLYKSMLKEAKQLNLEVPPLLKENLRKLRLIKKERKLAEARAKEESQKNSLPIFIDW